LYPNTNSSSNGSGANRTSEISASKKSAKHKSKCFRAREWFEKGIDEEIREAKVV
jgi:hypothetical protein